MILSPKQAAFLAHPGKRINICDGSVRSGKTHINNVKWIEYCARGPRGADLIIAGKTSDTIERNIIAPLKQLLGSKFRKVGRRAYLFDRTMHLIGANDESAQEKVRGITAAGVLGDEISLWPASFFKMMLSRMSITSAQLWGTTNPDAPGHWLNKEYLKRENELNLKRWQYRLEDNPSLDPQFVADLKKEYVGLWYKRFIDGQWVLAEGAIYDFFDEAIHVISVAPGQAQYYILAGDYGTSNPTCFILFGVNDFLQPRIWAEREYYYDAGITGHQKTDIEYAADLKLFLGDIQPRAIYIDPSAASFIVQLRRDGFLNIRETDNSVIDGIRTQARLLKSGEYAICQECSQTIEDYGQYVWDEKAGTDKGEDKPIKQNDHTKDTERYALQSHFGTSTYDLNKLIT